MGYDLCIFISGSEKMADELRVRTCIELIIHRKEYESNEALLSLSPNYSDAIKDCAGGVAVDIWAMCALPSVINREIKSIYPIMEDELNFEMATQLANTTFKPITDSNDDRDGTPLVILWTRVQTDGPAPWRPTHFVPLVCKTASEQPSEALESNYVKPEKLTCDHSLDASDNATAEDVHPACWTDAQCKYFKKENDWLFVNDGKLGCKVCKEAGDLGPNQLSPGMRGHLSEGWIDGKVCCNGKTKPAQQSSLRKKICGHRESDSHKVAIRHIELRKVESLRASINMQTAEFHQETCSVFRTAYHIAKSDRPYSDHPKLIKLQQLNGLSLGRVLHSNVTCSDIIDHIVCNMQKAIITEMLQLKQAFAVLIDESTSLSRASCLIIYIRTTFDEVVGPVTFFLDIVELSSTTAEGIEVSLLKCLADHGVTSDFLHEHWIGLGVDGASVMLGIKGGLAARLKKQYPKLISWHCFNHRLELSVHDAVKTCTETNHFKIFIDSLYAIYSMSPKCQRELSETAKELEMQISRIGKVLDVRWVASSLRTVKAVWRSYKALHTHFCSKAIDGNGDGREKAKFAGFAKKLENPVFIKNLGLMNDALEELSDLSLALQKSDVTLPVAHRLISRQVEVFQARRGYDTQCYREACESVGKGVFMDVAVSGTNGKEREIQRGQFYQALADSMASRMLPESEKSLCSSLSVLNINTWPTDLPIEYGEVDLRILCEKFKLPFSEVKVEYRNFKYSRGVDVGSSLKSLFNSIATVPVSTAECERGFSRMNLVCTPLRSRLTVSHMSSLLFISLTGPPLSDFKPIPYVKSWLAAKRRDATCVQCPTVRDELIDSTMQSIWRIL